MPLTMTCAAMMEPVAQGPVSLLDSASCEVCRPLLSSVLPPGPDQLSQALAEGGEELAAQSCVDFPPCSACSSHFLSPQEFLLPCWSWNLSEARQEQLMKGSQPPRGGQWVEFAATAALRFGRQTTSVSDKWECQVLPA